MSKTNWQTALTINLEVLPTDSGYRIRYKTDCENLARDIVRAFAEKTGLVMPTERAAR